MSLSFSTAQYRKVGSIECKGSSREGLQNFGDASRLLLHLCVSTGDCVYVKSALIQAYYIVSEPYLSS